MTSNQSQSEKTRQILHLRDVAYSWSIRIAAGEITTGLKILTQASSQNGAGAYMHFTFVQLGEYEACYLHASLTSEMLLPHRLRDSESAELFI